MLETLDAPAVPVPLATRRRLRWGRVVLLAVVVLVLAAEVVARLFLPEVPPLAAIMGADNSDVFEDLSTYRTVFAPDPLRGVWLKRGLKDAVFSNTAVTTNRDGYRMDQDVGPKTPQDFRLVCMGDAITYGYRIPIAYLENPKDHDDSVPYPVLMQRTLQAANPDKHVVAIPMACPGYSTWQGLLSARHHLAALQPDVVVILFGFGDSQRRPHRDEDVYPDGGWPVFWRSLLMDSQLATRLQVSWQRRQSRHPGPEPIQVPRVGVGEFGHNVEAMSDLAQACGADALVVSPMLQNPKNNPDNARYLDEYRSLLQSLNRQGRIHYLEIPEMEDGSAATNADLFIEDGIHPSFKGHQLIASRIIDRLRPVLAKHHLLLP